MQAITYTNFTTYMSMEGSIVNPEGGPPEFTSSMHFVMCIYKVGPLQILPMLLCTSNHTDREPNHAHL